MVAFPRQDARPLPRACCACSRCPARTRPGRCVSWTQPRRRCLGGILRRLHPGSLSFTLRARRCAACRCTWWLRARRRLRAAPGARARQPKERLGSPSLRRTRLDAAAAPPRLPRRLCALGISIEVTANGRTKALLLNDVLVGRGLSGAARQPPAPAAEPSLRRFAAMASLPATPPATPATRRLRRTRSSDPVAMQPAPQPAPQRADAPPPQRRLRSAGVMTRAGEAALQRSASPLFSFRCPITHCKCSCIRDGTAADTPAHRHHRRDGRPRRGRRWPFIRYAAR